jgi:uncharacterized protein YceH (UPF0502 family)
MKLQTDIPLAQAALLIRGDGTLRLQVAGKISRRRDDSLLSVLGAELAGAGVDLTEAPEPFREPGLVALHERVAALESENAELRQRLREAEAAAGA